MVYQSILIEKQARFYNIPEGSKQVEKCSKLTAVWTEKDIILNVS